MSVMFKLSMTIRSFFNKGKGLSLCSMQLSFNPASPITEPGELFSILLRLHPVEAGRVSPSSGSQAHAAFLDIVHQNDPVLAEQLRQPNKRRPFTVGLLQGFNHLPAAKLEEAITKNQKVQVLPGQVYWLRITMLDSKIFGTFIQHLITKPGTLSIRLGVTQFEVSRLIGSAEEGECRKSVDCILFFC